MGNSTSRNGNNAPGTRFFDSKKKQAARMMNNHYSRKNLDNARRINTSAIRNDLSTEFDIPMKLAFSETQTHKGLRNLSGENNCFLNATIQALWHLGPFRYELQNLISKAKLTDGKSSSEKKKKMGLLDALCNLFVEYQYTELSILPPTELRETLSELFKQFQLGEIADANETLEAILETIHLECTPKCCHNKHNCLAHNVFGGLLTEQATCLDCSSSSAPMLRSDFVHYVYAAELIALGQADVKRHLTQEDSSIDDCGPTLRNFGHLLHDCMGVSPRCCPSLDARTSGTPSADKADEGGPTINIESAPAATKCSGKADVKLYALEPPMALAISIGWTHSREKAETLNAFLSLVSYTIELGDLFDLSKQGAYNENRSMFIPKCGLLKSDSPTDTSETVDHTSCDNEPDTDCDANDSNSNSDNRRSSDPPFQYLKTVKKVNRDMKSPTYVFRGFVCYYGLHYISIFQEQQQGGEATFLLFDDQKIRPLGCWEQVKKECLKSLYQPVLLLYELQDTEGTARGYSYDDNSKGDELVEPLEPSAPPFSSTSTLRRMYNNADLANSLMASITSRRNSPIRRSGSPARSRSPLRMELLPRARSRSRTSSGETLGHTPPIMPIKSYEVKQKTKYVTLKYDFTYNRKLLGFEHGCDENGRIVFVGFQRHPESGKLLPAEHSGKIDLLDQLLAVDHTLIEKHTTLDVTKMFTEFLNDKTKKSVMLTVKSAQNGEVWFRCPYCEMEERMNGEEKLRLLGAHRNASGNSMKTKDDSTLTACQTCRLKGSTDGMYLNGILA